MSHRSLLPYGVHRCPFLDEGRPILVAVGNDGERVKQVIVQSGADELEIIAYLETVLARDHPKRRHLQAI